MIGSSVCSSRSSKPSEDSVTLTHHHWAFTQQDIWVCCITVSLHLWKACGCAVFFFFLISREKKKFLRDLTTQVRKRNKCKNIQPCKLQACSSTVQSTADRHNHCLLICHPPRWFKAGGADGNFCAVTALCMSLSWCYFQEQKERSLKIKTKKQHHKLLAISVMVDWLI